MHLKVEPVDLIHKGIDGMVQFGLPIKQGLVWHARGIDLFIGKTQLKCHISPTGFWADNSIRWINIQALVKKSGTVTLRLNKNIAPKVPSDLSTGEHLPPLGKNILYKHQRLPLTMSVELMLLAHASPIEINKVLINLKASELVQTYDISGEFVFENKKLLFTCNIQECLLTNEISIEARLHNPSAAAHAGGVWDLGDVNSVVIDSFSLIFLSPHSKTKLLLKDNEDPSTHKVVESDNFTLSQFGSGSANWQSPIHWNEHKQSTVLKQGFELLTHDGELEVGLRAEPLVLISNDDAFMQIALDGFWQNFPIVVSGEAGKHKWQLLSKHTELQGGESKTWKIYCRSANTESADETTSLLGANIQPEFKFHADYINQCEVLPHIALSKSPSKLSTFIQLGIESEHSFFHKRENKDVYGWRNYGELDADHEAVNAPEDTYFISHYNNQYDPLMGMTLQFLHSGNPKWLTLIHPLNQHIQDIDIYDTTEDKSEYNGGLMWHTDHYLSAETCTHRSNSKHHAHAYEGFLGGGGPGGQHCYTSGLTLQYRLFSDESAKHKVEQLCKWIRCFYNGSGSVAERTFRLLTIDLKQNVLTNIGVKAPGYKYPLDRGTGNYLIALLDYFDVSEDTNILDEMGDVIRNTFHPNEDIELRDLKNIEKSWFYTVYLQAVVRFLLLKETRQAIDEDYWYARHALMHYARWMLSNESFYLSSAEKLEFPNDTWCAQETRKMNLFCYFYYFDSTQSDAYLQKAKEYYQYIVAHMASSKEAHFTRILALLMQNDGVTQKFGLDQPDLPVPRSPIVFEEKKFGEAPTFSRYLIWTMYFRDVAKLLLHFSFKLEWRWLSLRVKSVTNK